MNSLPVTPLSREEQQKQMSQLVLLMEKQVRSYHKHRHMGSNSSIPAELAQELMASMVYTANLVGGIFAHRDPEEALKLGQQVLDQKLNSARSMLTLVNGTAPRWQTECRWEALRYLDRYLTHYDPLHLAHRGPDGVFYPILTAQPEELLGIDSCLYFLDALWIENQIMASVPDSALEALWDRLPVGTLNPCEQVLINGMGKALIGSGPEELVFRPEEREKLADAMAEATRDTLVLGANRLCGLLELKEERSIRYAESVIPHLAMWTGGSARRESLENLFL